MMLSLSVYTRWQHRADDINWLKQQSNQTSTRSYPWSIICNRLTLLVYNILSYMLLYDTIYLNIQCTMSTNKVQGGRHSTISDTIAMCTLYFCCHSVCINIMNIQVVTSCWRFGFLVCISFVNKLSVLWCRCWLIILTLFVGMADWFVW